MKGHSLELTHLLPFYKQLSYTPASCFQSPFMLQRHICFSPTGFWFWLFSHLPQFLLHWQAEWTQALQGSPKNICKSVKQAACTSKSFYIVGWATVEMSQTNGCLSANGYMDDMKLPKECNTPPQNRGEPATILCWLLKSFHVHCQRRLTKRNRESMIPMNKPLFTKASKTVQILTFNDNALKNTIFMLLPTVPP